MVVTPNFHFFGNCMEGIELYKKVFGAKILCLIKNKDANPIDYISDAKYSEHVYHAEIMCKRQPGIEPHDRQKVIHLLIA